MRKEILYNPLHVSSGEFLKGDTEEWKLKWQDPNFTRQFPTLVQRFLSEDRHTQFLEEHGQEMIRSAVSAFMQLPWNTREKGHIVVNGMGFTQNGEVRHLEKNELTASERPTVDSLMKAEIASLLLLGFGPSNQEGTKNCIVKCYQSLPPSKKDSYRNNVFRLIINNSSTRRWIKENQLDVKNGFSWDKSVATRLALSLIPPRQKEFGEGLIRTLPNELSNLEHFAPETIEGFVDYVLGYVKSLPTISPNRKDLWLFIFEAEKYRDVLTQPEKLSELNNLLKPH